MKPLLITLLFSSASFAQIIYLPVQYQYGSQNPYYYGGHNPRVFRQADDPCTTVTGRVYLDCRPFQNSAIYGYGPDDARNEAYANVPTYYRKSDFTK